MSEDTTNITPVRGRGRGSKKPWLSSYDENMPALYYQYRAQGLTISAVAKKLGVTKSTIYAWKSDSSKPEFKEAFEAGQDAAQAHYEEKLKEFIESGECKPAQKDLIQFMLRTQFKEDWAESRNQTIEITDRTKNLNDDNFKQLVTTELKRLLKLRPDLEIIKNN